MRSVVHGTFLVSSSLHFLLCSRFTAGDNPAAHRRDAVFAVELLRATPNTFGNGAFEDGDGAVAVVEYRRISDRSFDEDFPVTRALFYQGLLRSFGHFNHDEMLAVYCLAVLAFTPCGDAFSLDSRMAKARKERPPFAYAYPILLMQLLMAWSYFSSALIKLRVAGFKYLSPDNLPALAIFHSLDNLHDTHFRLAFWLPQVRAGCRSQLCSCSSGSWRFRWLSSGAGCAGGFWGSVLFFTFRRYF